MNYDSQWGMIEIAAEWHLSFVLRLVMSLLGPVAGQFLVLHVSLNSGRASKICGDGCFASFILSERSLGVTKMPDDCLQDELEPSAWSG